MRQAGTAAPADRQRIARLLLGRVAVTVDKTSERVDVQLQRAGGLIRSHVVSRPVTRHDRQSDYPRLVERMRAPADQRLHSAEIAARRNDEGFRPPRRAKRFTAGSVQRLAARLGLPRRNYYGSQAGLGRDEFRPRGLARRPGVSREVVRRWLRTGCVTARPDEDRHPIIWAGASELRRPRELQRLQRAGVTGARLEKLKRPKPRPRRQSACSPREEQAPGLVAPRRAPASRGWLCEEPRPSEAAHHVPPPSDRGREAAAASGASLPRSFAPRRRPILLASATGQGPSVIATSLGCSAATVRNASHAFAVEGLSSLMAESSAPKQPSSIWQRQRADELRALLHQSPRPFGKARSTWALELLAEVCHERGLTARQLSAEATRGILVRLGIHLKRAKLWVTSPDPNRAAKKARRDRLIRLAAQHPDGVLGFEDEVWWSRVARPSLGTRTDGEPLKVELLQAEDRDPDPEAIACYGSLRLDLRKVMLRFVEDRPRADVTIPFLDWLCGSVATAGKRVLLVTWDDASWHTADAVSLWVRAHNEHARQSGGVKMVTCEPPVASPRLNNLEPCWKHAKKAIYGARPQTDGGGDGKACLPALRR